MNETGGSGRNILIVDDDEMVRLAVSENLKDKGFVPIEASSGEEALRLCGETQPVSILLDIKMPGIDGMETLRRLKQLDPEIPVIMLTAHGDISSAVKATKLGAYDFILKPPDFELLALTLNRAAEKFELNRAVQMLNTEVESSLEYLCGKSSAMKQVIRQIHQVSRSDFSLIIQGETGTGKSFISRCIHNLSGRAKGPFVTVDIGSMPETLVESELFGHEKGAFTGADRKRKGFFEIADHGTILIDELQNLSPFMQSKLLKVVEEKSIYSLGSTEPLHTDVRIIGATNTDIIRAVNEKKTFREDLFYRLGEFMISLPPLRERPEDIIFLAKKFVMEAAEDLDKHVHSFSDEADELLRNYSWPGNIRELKNVVRRAVLLTGDNVIRPEHIELLKGTAPPVCAEKGHFPKDIFSNISLQEVEKNTIKHALESVGGNKTKAASILKIDYSTLLRKIKRYGI